MSVARFYDLETQKIAADGELVSLFTKHPGTLGAFREARLRDYLREHIGTRYELASGFVVDNAEGAETINDRSSRQIDCLVYDRSRQAPLMSADSFVAVLPAHVGGFVEVKSDLRITRKMSDTQSGDHPFEKDARFYRWSGTLVDALANLKSGIEVMRDAGVPREDYFAGIFAYDGDELIQFEQALVSGELMDQLSITDIDDLPDSICIINRGWWGFSAYQWNDVDPELDREYDPEMSYLLQIGITAGKGDGSPLQLFTAYLSNSFDGREGLAHRTGGLRSFVGRKASVKNIQLKLPCPGKGTPDSCD